MFCGSGDMSEEHIVADWVLRAFLRTQKPQTHFSGRPEADSKMQLEAGEAISTARVVCRLCNNEWLSRIDEHAAQALKPLVRGRGTVTLGAEAQSAVSAWIFKCGLVFDAHQGGLTGPLSGLRHTFMESKQAPPGATIYLGPAPPTPFVVEGVSEVARLALFGVKPTTGAVNLHLKVRKPDGSIEALPPKQLASPGWTVMLGRVNAIISGRRAPIVPTPEFGFQRVWPSSANPVVVSSELDSRHR